MIVNTRRAWTRLIINQFGDAGRFEGLLEKISRLMAIIRE